MHKKMSCVGNLQSIVFLNERYWGQTLTLAKKLRGRYLMLYFHTQKNGRSYKCKSFLNATFIE